MENNTTLSGFETIVDNTFKEGGIQYTESSASLTDAEIDAIYNREPKDPKDVVVRDAFGNEIAQPAGVTSSVKDVIDDVLDLYSLILDYNTHQYTGNDVDNMVFKSTQLTYIQDLSGSLKIWIDDIVEKTKREINEM